MRNELPGSFMPSSASCLLTPRSPPQITHSVAPFDIKAQWKKWPWFLFWLRLKRLRRALDVLSGQWRWCAAPRQLSSNERGCSWWLTWLVSSAPQKWRKAAFGGGCGRLDGGCARHHSPHSCALSQSRPSWAQEDPCTISPEDLFCFAATRCDFLS